MRLRSLAPTALLALALLLPTTLAGTEAAPEVDDAPNRWADDLDMLSAWLENTWSGIRFTVKVEGLTGIPAQRAYFVGFDIDGTRHVAYLSFDAEGQAHSVFARPGFGDDYPTIDTYPDTLQDVKVRTGRPAYVSATIPWGAAEGLDPGAIVTDIYAGTEDNAVRDSQDYVDILFTESAFLAERAVPYGPILIGAGIGAAIGTAGVIVLALRRRTQRVEVPEDAAPQPARVSTGEPGPRLALRPPR